MAFAHPASQTAAPLEAVAGTVERVTYHNAENGFAVLKVQTRGKRDLVTVVGHAASVMEGEWITASGSWVSDRTHGVQFKAQTLSATPPTGAQGIEKYLASGLLKADDEVVIYNTGSGLKYLDAYSVRFPRSAGGEQDKLGGLITPR